METRQPAVRRKAKVAPFVAVPRRGVLAQLGSWKIEVAGPKAAPRLEARTLRAGEAIAALLNGQDVETDAEDTPAARYEALPRAEGWLVVRLRRRDGATEIARTSDEALALRVASLLNEHTPALVAPPRRSIMRFGMRPPPPS